MKGVRRERIGANGYGIAEESECACGCGVPLYRGDRSWWDTLRDIGPFVSMGCVVRDRADSVPYEDEDTYRERVT